MIKTIGLWNREKKIGKKIPDKKLAKKEVQKKNPKKVILQKKNKTKKDTKIEKKSVKKIKIAKKPKAEKKIIKKKAEPGQDSIGRIDQPAAAALCDTPRHASDPLYRHGGPGRYRSCAGRH